MNTNDERLRILTLVKAGRIDINEAIDMLHNLDKRESTPHQTDQGPVSPSKDTPRLLRILKTDSFSQKTLVDLSVPIDLVRAGMRVGANFYLDLAGLNSEQLDMLLDEPSAFSRYHGDVILDFEDEKTNEHLVLLLQ